MGRRGGCVGRGLLQPVPVPSEACRPFILLPRESSPPACQSLADYPQKGCVTVFVCVGPLNKSEDIYPSNFKPLIPVRITEGMEFAPGGTGQGYILDRMPGLCRPHTQSQTGDSEMPISRATFLWTARGNPQARDQREVFPVPCYYARNKRLIKNTVEHTLLCPNQVLGMKASPPWKSPLEFVGP